jgi:flagella basal body P-ring formation protein FlgA
MSQQTTKTRHNKRNLIALLAFTTGFATVMPISAHAQTAPEQLIGVTSRFLEAAVTSHLENNKIEGRTEIKVADLDPRLVLRACDNELVARLESPAQPIGRVTVRVRCEGISPWTVFVPARVSLYRNVVAITRPLKRESVLSSEDITLLEKDVGYLTQGYLTSLDQALGKKLTRSVLSDQILLPNQLEQAEIIRKGDQVTINAKSGSVVVRMPGEALSDGALDQQIRIKNLSSKRVIRARVVGAGIVEVDM